MNGILKGLAIGLLAGAIYFIPTILSELDMIQEDLSYINDTLMGKSI